MNLDSIHFTVACLNPPSLPTPPSPTRPITLDRRRKLIRRTLVRLAAHADEPALHIFPVQRLANLGLQVRNDLFRRAGRREHAVPGRGAEALDRLADGRRTG